MPNHTNIWGLKRATITIAKNENMRKHPLARVTMKRWCGPHLSQPCASYGRELSTLRNISNISGFAFPRTNSDFWHCERFFHYCLLAFWWGIVRAHPKQVRQSLSTESDVDVSGNNLGILWNWVEALAKILARIVLLCFPWNFPRKEPHLCFQFLNILASLIFVFLFLCTCMYGNKWLVNAGTWALYLVN